jgi:glycosyltransferase involved in cell wall biosynthesis
VEAQACGTPVIAFGRGGVVETVNGLDSAAPTGVFYAKQTPEALAAAVRRFEGLDPSIPAAACRENALRFRSELFRGGLRAFIGHEWERYSELRRLRG